MNFKLSLRGDNHDIVYISVSHQGKRIFVSTGIHATQTQFDAALDLSNEKSDATVRFIRDIFSKLEKLHYELLQQDAGSMTVDEIVITVKSRVFGQSVRSTTDLFLSFFQTRIDAYVNRSTKESFGYTMRTIEKFDGNARNLKFSDITYAWLKDFETWMTGKRLSQNTRKIHFGNIRAVMREAYKRELTENDPFRRFSFKPAKTRKRSLDIESLRLLFSFPAEPFARYYLDMLKLSFLLIGINTVDLYELEAIKDGRIEYVRSKTEGLFSIKVEPEALEIIERHRGKTKLLDIADRWKDYRNFRKQMNMAIRRLGKAQGKGKKDNEEDGPFSNVTSYWMRHTWATLAYELGISEDTISHALGHQGTGARVTEVYIRRNMDKVDEANRKVIDWVFGCDDSDLIR